MENTVELEEKGEGEEKNFKEKVGEKVREKEKRREKEDSSIATGMGVGISVEMERENSSSVITDTKTNTITKTTVIEEKTIFTRENRLNKQKFLIDKTNFELFKKFYRGLMSSIASFLYYESGLQGFIYSNYQKINYIMLWDLICSDSLGVTIFWDVDDDKIEELVKMGKFFDFKSFTFSQNYSIYIYGIYYTKIEMFRTLKDREIIHSDFVSFIKNSEYIEGKLKSKE